MSKGGWACLGFILVLVGGSFIAYTILDRMSEMRVESEYAIGFIGLAIIIIPILSILGAIIGYFAGGTSSKT